MTCFLNGAAKRGELLARAYDHVRYRYNRGYHMLTQGWSDSVTFLSLNFCLLSTKNSRIVFRKGKC